MIAKVFGSITPEPMAACRIKERGGEWVICHEHVWGKIMHESWSAVKGNNPEEIIEVYREQLHAVSDDAIRIVNALKEISGADHIELLRYRNDQKDLYDVVRKNSFKETFLDSRESFVGQTYHNKEAIQTTSILTESVYSTAMDNPYKLDITAQILIPILDQEAALMGIVRLSRRKPFDASTYHTLMALKEAYAPIFSGEAHYENIQAIEADFMLDAQKVYALINSIGHNVSVLQQYVSNPEISKLVFGLKEQIDSIRDYLDTGTEAYQQHNQYLETHPEQSEAGMHVLIADDVKMNTQILEAMIGNAAPGVSMDVAYDGLETMEKVQTLLEGGDSRLNLLFLDHHMPGKLGIEIAEHVREYEKKHPGVPHIILISITNDPEAIEAKKALFDYHISKPFSREKITAVIRNIEKKFS